MSSPHTPVIFCLSVFDLFWCEGRLFKPFGLTYNIRPLPRLQVEPNTKRVDKWYVGQGLGPVTFLCFPIWDKINCQTGVNIIFFNDKRQISLPFSQTIILAQRIRCWQRETTFRTSTENAKCCRRDPRRDRAVTKQPHDSIPYWYGYCIATVSYTHLTLPTIYSV